MKKITGIILAGGKSSRMGSDKGLLDLEGKKFINHIIDAIVPVVDELIIVANNSNYNDLGYKVVGDLVKGCGPMGGIYTGLMISETEKNLIVSCDIPDISTATLQTIISQSGKEDVTVPLHNEISEPLCAVYHKTCTTEFKKCLDRKEFKMRDALENLNVKYVHFGFNDFFSADDFANINTLGELETRKQKMK